MLISSPVFFTLAGRRAAISVIRNDGYCWGRLRFFDDPKNEYDITTRRDYYDRLDSEAIEAFQRAAARGKYEPAAGYLQGPLQAEASPIERAVAYGYKLRALGVVPTIAALMRGVRGLQRSEAAAAVAAFRT